jgi:hypothetical protein
MPEPDVEPQDPPVVVEADGDVMLLRAFVRARDEVLAPVLGELDRLSQQPGGPRHEHLFWPRMHDLDAEAAADVRRDDVDLAQVQAQLGGHGSPHPGRGLRRGPQAQVARLRVPVRQHAAPFQRRGRRALDRQVEFQHARRRRDHCRGVAALLHRIGGDVSGDVVVHEVPGSASRVDSHDSGQWFIAHVDEVDRVLGQVPVGRDDHDHRLADVVDLAGRQRVRRPPVGERRMRDQQGERLGEPAGQILVGIDRDQAGHVERAADVDVGDARVRVRAAHERRREHPDAKIVEVGPVPADQPVILDPLDTRAEQRAHGRPSPARACLASSA